MKKIDSDKILYDQTIACTTETKIFSFQNKHVFESSNLSFMKKRDVSESLYD